MEKNYYFNYWSYRYEWNYHILNSQDKVEIKQVTFNREKNQKIKYIIADEEEDRKLEEIYPLNKTGKGQGKLVL